MTFFDLDGNRVAAREFGIVENLANQPLGQQVLHEHIVDGILLDARIKRRAAHLDERRVGSLELLVARVGVDDLFLEVLGDVGHALLEFIDGLLEGVDLRLDVIEERLEQPPELFAVAEVDAHDLGLVLDQDGDARIFEDDVAQRVALLDLLADFHIQVIVRVLSFPVAADQAHGVFEGAVGRMPLALSCGISVQC